MQYLVKIGQPSLVRASGGTDAVNLSKKKYDMVGNEPQKVLTC